MFYKFKVIEEHELFTPVIEADSLEEAIKIAVNDSLVEDDLESFTKAVNYTECENEDDADYGEWEDEDVKDKYLKIVYGH